MTTALVTGGAGFIATNLCQRLLDMGYAVIAVDNFITSSGDNPKALKKDKNFTFIKHDIIQPFPKSVTDKKIDILFHLACPTGVPNLIPLAEEMILTNSLGTKNVLDLANKKNAQLLFTSSSEVYGDPEVFPQAEEYTGNVNPDGVRSPYEEGKRFSESMVMMYVRKYGVDAKIVRIFNTYGPLMSLSDSRVIPNFLHKALHNKPLPVQGDGRQRRTFCYVDDLVDGFLLVMKKGKKGEVYNLGSDKETTIAALAKKIMKATHAKSKLKHVPRPSHDHKRRLPNLKKIRSLGWEQQVDLDEGLKRTIEWYKLVI
jgi:nucleoside-diphosphate-sugar epimerase